MREDHKWFSKEKALMESTMPGWHSATLERVLDDLRKESATSRADSSEKEAVEHVAKEDKPDKAGVMD